MALTFGVISRHAHFYVFLFNSFEGVNIDKKEKKFLFYA